MDYNEKETKMDTQNEKDFDRFINAQKTTLKEAKKAFAKYLIFKGIEYAAVALVAYGVVKAVNKLEEDANKESNL